MGRLQGHIFCILVSLAMRLAPALADAAPEIYVDNHRVKCTVVRSNGEIYVDARALASAMHATYTESGGQPAVNGKPLRATRQGTVSLKELVAAAGARLQINAAAGIVDVITFDPHARAQAIDARERERAATMATSRPAAGSVPPAVESEQPVDLAQMDGIYQRSLSQLRVTLGMGIPVLPTCHFVPFNEISQSGAARGELVLGYTQWQRVDGKLYIDVYVPYGLSYGRTLHIMIHELAHCWEANYDVNIGTRRIGEGFAEWAAYTVLKSLRYDKESERAFHLPEDYTEGFKYFERMAQRIGAVATVEQVRQMKH